MLAKDTAPTAVKGDRMLPGAWRTMASTLITCVGPLTASAAWGTAATAASEDSLDYKFMSLISGEVPTDYLEGGFGGSATNLAYGALYNLWLDPKEARNFLIRKLPYISIYEQCSVRHLATFRVYPPKRVVEMPTR